MDNNRMHCWGPRFPGSIPQCGIAAGAVSPRLGRTPISRLTRGNLGDLDLHPKLDLAENGIEIGVARALLEMADGRLKPGEGGGGQRPAQEPDLELIER